MNERLCIWWCVFRLQHEVSLLQQQLAESRQLLHSLQSELQLYDRVCGARKSTAAGKLCTCYRNNHTLKNKSLLELFIHTHVIANLYKCLCFSETQFRQTVLLHTIKCRPVQLQKWQKYHKTALKVVHMRRVLYSSHVHKWFLELSANCGGKNYQRVTVYSCSICILIYEPLRLLTELLPPTSLPTSPPLSQGVCVRCRARQ